MQKRVEKSGSDACAFHVKICVSITLNLMTGLEKPVTEARVGRIIKIVLQWGADDLFSANQKVFLKLPSANQRQANHPHTQLLPSQVRKRLSWSKKNMVVCAKLIRSKSVHIGSPLELEGFDRCMYSWPRLLLSPGTDAARGLSTRRGPIYTWSNELSQEHLLALPEATCHMWNVFLGPNKKVFIEKCPKKITKVLSFCQVIRD